MKHLLPALLIAALASPGFAGGPVIVEDAEEVVAEAAGSGNLLVPLLAVLVIGLALSGGSDRGDQCNREIVKC